MPTVPGTPTNPYDSLVAQDREETSLDDAVAQLPGPGGGNPYDAILQADAQRQKTALAASLQLGAANDPDKHAQNLALAKESGLPVGAVEVDPAAVQSEQRMKRLSDTVSKSPLLSAWYSQDDNAVLAMDDYENLTGLESAMRAVGDVVKAPISGLVRTFGQGIQGLGAINDAVAHGTSWALRGVGAGAAADALEAPVLPYWANPSSWARGVGKAIEGTAGAPLSADRANFATDIGEGIGSLIGQAAASYFNPAAGAALMAGQGAQQQADQADKAGATQEQKDKAVVLGAAITAATEKMGLDLLLERLPPKVKGRVAQWLVDKTIAAGIEGTQEGVEQVANNLVAQMIYDPNNPLMEGVADNASVGAAVGGIARVLLGIRGRGYEAGQVKGDQTALDGMVKATVDSKLGQRAPERFEGLVRQMAAEGATTVYVPVENAQKLFQSMEPAQAAEQLGVPVESYMEAVITGGDIAIPVETYLSRVAPTHHEALRDVARFTAGAMTPEETATLEMASREGAARFEAAAQENAPSDQAIYDDVTGMLLGTGRYRRQDVEKYAQIMQAGFRTLGAREGVDAFDLYSQYRLKIKSELPAVLQATDIDTVIDPLIDRLRAGDIPRDDRASLSDFLAASGGINDPQLTGEIATLAESDRAVRAGKPRLVTPEGQSLDMAREAAAEAGYLPADSDVNDLLALLDGEMGGSPAYAQGAEETQRSRTREAVMALDEELGRRGIDIKTATNQQIKAALFGDGQVPQVPDELAQVFDQSPAAPPAAGPVPEMPEIEQLRARVAQLETELRTDNLTSLRNQKAFDEDEALGWPAVAAADMDGLKRLNDSIGHEAADQVLKALGGVFLSSEVSGVRFYRRSGDEFAARFEDASTGERVMAELQQRLDRIAIDLDVQAEDGTVRQLTYEGIGISYGNGTNYETADAGANRNKSERLAAGQREEARAVGEPRRLRTRSGDGQGRRRDDQGSTELSQSAPQDARGWKSAARDFVKNSRVKKPVYHATAADFDAFDTTKSDLGAHFGTDDQANHVAERRLSFGDRPASVMQVYLNVENPLRLKDEGSFHADAIADQLARKGIISKEDSRRIKAEDWRGRAANNPFVRDAIKSAGYDGVVYKNAQEGAGDSYIAFDPGQIKSATANSGAFDPSDPSILNQSDPAEAIRRGYIKFGGDRQFTIALLEKADATTFLHETGHFFLEVLGDLATAPNASPDLVADYNAALKWLGVESRDQIKVDQHEQWARGFEAYLGEGRAPTAELAPAFARFKAWVKAIYRTLRALNVDLTDDVRGVFDRLLATDQEITQAETSMDYTGLFKDATAAGWTEAEFAARLKLAEQAREESEGRLMARAMKDVTRETRAWWKEREAEVREEVQAEVHAMPVYRALVMLQDNAAPDGTPIDGEPFKLSKQALVDLYGQQWLNENLLRKRVYQAHGGADPDLVALQVGFESGDAMVRALANVQPMDQVIKAQAHQRMIDQYGDVMTDGTMPEQAMRAVHGDRRFKAIEADLRALERLAGEPKASSQQLRAVAQQIVGAKRVRDLQPNTYLRAERKAAREAVTASGRQEWGQALEAQRRRLLNAHLYDVASRAQDETGKLQRYVQRFTKTKLRQRLGKVDRLDQVDTLLAQYDLRQVSGRKIDAGKAKADLLAQIDAGVVVAPQSFVERLRADAQRTNWRELTVEELRGLRDVLAQAEAAARLEYEALMNGERIVLDDKADEMASAIEETGKSVMPVYGTHSPDEDVKKWGKQVLLSWLRPSSLARLLDGKDDGAWTRNIIQPIRRAVVEQLEPMKRKVNDDLSALYSKHYTNKEIKQMQERRVVPGLGVSLSRWDLISLAMNWGNAENREAVLKSTIAGNKPFTEAGVNQALASLDRRDLLFVQEAWDMIDSYWPQIKDAQKRRNGISPPKVQALAFVQQLASGESVELRGGYYPLKYNGQLDARARQNEMDDAWKKMQGGTTSSVQTQYGHTKERIGSGGQPVLLSMNVLGSHLNSVVMDLALGDTVIAVDKLLARPQVRNALIQTGNLDALETFKLWLKDVSVGEMGARSGVERLAQLTRFGFTKSKLGFNFVTAASQLAGMSQAVPVVGSKHMVTGAMDMAKAPRQAIKQVMAQSKFMAARYELNTFNKDIAAVQDAFRKGAPDTTTGGWVAHFITAVRAIQLPERAVQWAFFGIRQTQLLVDTTTWLAGYNRAASEGKAHDQAVLYADGIVENSQTSGLFSDRAAIERGSLSDNTRQSELVKLWTTLMGPMVAKGNIAYESYRRTDFKDPGQIFHFGSDMLLLFLAEAILIGALKGGWPDDDESWFGWGAKTAATQAISTVPVLREIPSFASGFGSSGGPFGGTAREIGNAITRTDRAIDKGEADRQLVKAYITLIGTATGAPSVQTNRMIDAYWRESQGEDVPAYEYVIGKRKD